MQPPSSPNLRIAKVFTNGGSQAVRLPVEFRFETNVVYIRRDTHTNEVILSSEKPRPSWAEFRALCEEQGPLPEADEFVAALKSRSSPSTPKDPFEGWAE